MIMTSNKGFTIIEILIVLVIVGILATITIPNYIGLTESAKRETLVSNMRILLMRIEVYRAENNGYPGYDSPEGTTYNSGEFINDYKEEWNSLSEIYILVNEFNSNTENIFKYEINEDEFIFSVKIDDNDFIGISKESGLQSNLSNHLSF